MSVEDSYISITNGTYVYVGGICGSNSSYATVANCYFLKESASGGIGDGGEATEKTAEQFASGEVAWLLGSDWEQELGTAQFPTPIMTTAGKTYRVVKITVDFSDATENAICYANKDQLLRNYPNSGAYVFYEEGSYKTRIDPETKTYEADTTIYAKKQSSGTVQQKTLTFDVGGGSKINAVTENYGKTIVLADYTPKRDGYEFLGWYKDEKLTEKIEYAVLDYDMTVYAKWQKITETVDYDTLIVLTINDKTSVVNGEAVNTDVAPLIVNGRTYTSARFVAESLGAKVVWDEKTKTVTITKDDTTIILRIDTATAYVNGKAVEMDASAFIADGRTFTPARFVAEQLGAKVEWNEETRTVTIWQ